MVSQGVGVDMYIITKDALVSWELASSHFIATHSGGSVHLYSPFVPQE
jgi:hypothetical protein